MGRVLTLQRSLVTPNDRSRYLERLKVRQAYYTSAGCNFWVFEEAGLPGAFIEFTEGKDARTLRAAHAAAPETLLDPTRIYAEVELS